MTPGHAKRDYRRLVQRCGFGVPDLGRALRTVGNSLTLLVQGPLQPFQKERGKRPTTHDMHLHRLPWRHDALESLGATELEMRVTLSYFIEPNPSQRGNSRYRYRSHGLWFDLMRPTETSNAFRAPINAAVERQGPDPATSDPRWLLGATKPAPGLVALRHLARDRCRTRKPSTGRRLSDDWLMAHAGPARLRQPSRTLRPSRQRPRARHRCGPVHRSRQSHRRVDRNVTVSSSVFTTSPINASAR